MQELNNSEHSSVNDRFEIIEKGDYSALKLRYLELTSLFEINKILNSSLDLTSILDNVLLTPMGRLMVSKGMVLLIDYNNMIKVENVKGLSTSIIGKRYMQQVLPQQVVLLDQSQDLQSQFLLDMINNNMDILIPMSAGGNYLGILAYGKKFNLTPYSQEDIDFLESLANLAAIAVNKSLMFEEIKSTNKKLDKKVQELNTLFEISRELNSSLDQSQVTQMLSFAIMGELLINKCVIFVETNSRLCLEVAKGLTKDLNEFKAEDYHVLFLKMFAADQRVIVFEEFAGIPEYKTVCSLFLQEDLHYLIPMKRKNQIKGMIGIGKKITGEEITVDDFSFLETLGNEAIMTLENVHLVQEMLEKQRMQEELKIAREIQKNLLPQKLPVYSGYEIIGENIPSFEVGGDYYDVVALTDNRFGVTIADVSGKSTPAALLMANLQASFKALVSKQMSILDTIEGINKIIYENTTPDKFITFFYGIFDTRKKTLTYTNAGHNPPYVIRSNGEILQLNKGGLILGLVPNAKYELDEIKFQAGDFFYCFTDGVTEALNSKDEEYSEIRLEQLLRQIHQSPLKEIHQKIKTDIQEFVAEMTQHDDLTMVMVKALP